MKNNMDAFEQQLRDTLENYEVPYNSSDWVQMERALSSGVRGWGHGRTLIAGLLVGAALLIGGTAYYIGRDAMSEEIMEKVAATGVATTDGTDQGAIAAQKPLAEQVTGQGTVAKMEQASWADQAQAHQDAPLHASQAAAQHGTGNMLPPTATTAPLMEGGKTPAAPTGTFFKASAKEACSGSPVEFTVENMPEDGIYLWNFGDGSFSNKPNPQHVYTKPGNYQVMLSMSASGIGAIHNKPTSDMIVIHEAPYAAFDIVSMNYSGQVPAVHFESRALGGASYLWDFGDGTSSTEASPDHVYRKKGSYQVVQTVTNSIGCMDRKVQELVVENDFDLRAPKSFSPNHDGKDDSFMPVTLTKLTAKFVLAIYDPNGNMVYTTSDATRPWYGKVRNMGPVLDGGDYVWVADIDTDRGVETFTGTVRLVR